MEFIEAATADEGIEKLRAIDDVDAVLLDLSMPGGEPWDNLARLRAAEGPLERVVRRTASPVASAPRTHR